MISHLNKPIDIPSSSSVTQVTMATSVNKLTKSNIDSKLNQEKLLKVPGAETLHNSRSHSLPNNSSTSSETLLKRDGSPTSTLRIPWKIVILGDAGVGKSSIVKKFINGSFTPTYNPTVEDNYLHTITFPDGVSQCIEILDTSGFYEFPAMRELNIKCSLACLLVFDLNREESLRSLVELHKVIRTIKGNCNIPMVLVGNKCDVTDEKCHEISEQASKLAQNVFKCLYYEASAKENKNVEILFKKLVDLVRLQFKLEQSSRRESNASNGACGGSGLQLNMRRNSTISFARRISINVGSKNYNQTRRYSEPVVCNNIQNGEGSGGSNDSMGETNKVATNRMSRKRQKNCVVS